jgi:hypothetical protein
MFDAVIRAAIVAIAVTLLAAAPARAGTVRVEYAPKCAACASAISFRAAPGERNVLSIVRQLGSYLVSDAGAAITPGEGCVAVVDGVRCAGNLMDADLGDGDDVARADGSAWIAGGTGDDRITGGDGVFSGGPGDDIVTGHMLWDDDGRTAGHDTYIGVGLRPRLSYLSRTGGVHADLRPGHPSEDRISGVSEIEGGAGDDVLIGDDQANFLSGGRGADRVIGLGGDDHLVGDAVLGGAGDDEVLGGAVVPRCGPGQDVVLTTGDSLVGPDCERIGKYPASSARPRMRLPRLRSPFLLELPSCAECPDEHWEATVYGRLVASAGAARSLRLNASGRRLLRRERTLRLRVTHTSNALAIEGGPPSLVHEGFRIDVRF